MISAARAARGVAGVVLWQQPSARLAGLGTAAALANRRSSTSSLTPDEFADQVIGTQPQLGPRQEGGGSGAPGRGSSTTILPGIDPMPHLIWIEATAPQDQEPSVDGGGEAHAIEKEKGIDGEGEGEQAEQQLDDPAADPLLNLPSVTQLQRNIVRKYWMESSVKYQDVMARLSEKSRPQKTAPTPQSTGPWARKHPTGKGSDEGPVRKTPPGSQPLVRKHLTGKGAGESPERVSPSDTRPRIVCFHNLPRNTTKEAVLTMISIAGEKDQIPAHACRVVDVRTTLPGVMYVEFLHHLAAFETHRAARSGYLEFPGVRGPLETTLHKSHHASGKSAGAGLARFNAASRAKYIGQTFRKFAITRRVKVRDDRLPSLPSHEHLDWRQPSWLDALPKPDEVQGPERDIEEEIRLPEQDNQHGRGQDQLRSEEAVDSKVPWGGYGSGTS